MLSSITPDGGFSSISDLAKGIYERPGHPRYTASLILQLACGHRVNSTDDKYVRLSETAVTGTVQGGMPGSQVVDFFPACESSLFFSFFPLCLFLNLKLLLSEIYTGVASWDGVQTTRCQGSQGC